MVRLTTLAVVLVTIPMPVSASEPAFYFHRPSVDRAAFDVDLDRCVGLASGTSVQRQSAYSPNIYAAAMGGFLSGVMASRERRAIVRSVMRTCMADRGYRRVTLPAATERDFAALKDEAKTTRLFELATAPATLGEVLPR